MTDAEKFPVFTHDRCQDEISALKALVHRAWETHNEFLRGPYTDLQVEAQNLRAEIMEALEVIRSIACLEKSLKFFRELDEFDLREIVITDTELCREFLKRIGEKG